MEQLPDVVGMGFGIPFTPGRFQFLRIHKSSTASFDPVAHFGVSNSQGTRLDLMC
jgi:hypothetical protein